MPDEPELYKGSDGDWVEYLQQGLQQHGYWTGPVDGQFGDELEQALIYFQEANALIGDGVARADTWAALIGGVADSTDQRADDQHDASWEQTADEPAVAAEASRQTSDHSQWSGERFTNEEIDDPDTEEAPAPEPADVDADSPA